GDGLWPNSGEVIEDIPAHEFHYASLEGVSGDQRYAYKVIRGHGIDGEQDGLILNNLTACFAHQRNLTDNKWAENFVGFVRQHKMSRPSSEASQEALTA
ncbi:MAG: cobyrinic acid a,c-diamide synthase, partial [Rhodospirillaceae bacterium]|nr:cobyrinic acid a,c-diamide synthase [Rhodospirillaceae bacterium]